ncbi:hypothetical protein DYB31_013842, partial [Aphanomyces astaci]
MFRLISKIQHDPDTHDCTAATLALADLSSWASSLVAASPVPRLQAVIGNFFPIYLRNLDVKHLNCMHAMDGIPPAPADSMQQMAAHMLAHSLRSDVPAVMHCASDLFVDAISSSSSSSAKDDTAARGFQAADGRFDADIAPDKLWRLPLFFDSTDVKSTADLIVWH